MFLVFLHETGKTKYAKIPRSSKFDEIVSVCCWFCHLSVIISGTDIHWSKDVCAAYIRSKAWTGISRGPITLLMRSLKAEIPDDQYVSVGTKANLSLVDLMLK